MSKFVEAMEKLSKQPQQEQELLTKGVEQLKAKFERPKTPQKNVERTM